MLVFVAACGGGGPASTGPANPANPPQTPRGVVTPPPQAAATCIDPVTDGEQVALTEHKFPAEIRVGVGETVTFNNEDDLNHTVSFRGSGSPDCGIMLIGQSISVRLEGPGTYDYFCQFHRPDMVGKIIVE
jgi:plastocyanin